MQKKAKNYWGFDVKGMDKTVRPQDDFYKYANGNWLKKNRIPETEAWWGSFLILRFETEKQLKKILEDLARRKGLKKGSEEQIVRDLFASAMDMKTRERAGLAPLKPWQEKIKSISDQPSLLTTIGEFHRFGISVPFATYVDQDSKNSKKYALHFTQSGLGLPDRDYYIKDEPEFLRVREAYKKHVVSVFRLLGYSISESARHAETVLQVETRLAKASMDKVDTRDAEKIYHKKTFSELARLSPAIAWKRYFRDADIPLMPYVIVGQPHFMQEVDRMIKSVSIPEWQTYLEWHLASDASPYLTKKFLEANFDFYGRVLTGSKKMKPDWRRSLGVVNGYVGEALGKLYVKKHFKPQAKRKMDQLVDDLFIAFEKRANALHWMTPATRRKAISKLHKIARKIAYPAKWKSYRGLVIDPRDYFGNITRASEFHRRREMKKLKGPIDRNEWFMSPQVVNAYFHPTLNEIVFPAAILQHPFFDPDADDAVNYAAIGSVIGHEITHAFDDQGAKFDGDGNLKSWWTPKDKKQFEDKGKILVEQYSAFKVRDEVSVNGQLTLGENIADLGGLVIAFDAYQHRLGKTGRKTIGGFTPEERFFLGFAQQERELRRPEFAKTAALTDPHSPAEYRINGPLANFEKFYQVYSLTQKDKLYREAKKRAKIW